MIKKTEKMGIARDMLTITDRPLFLQFFIKNLEIIQKYISERRNTNSFEMPRQGCVKNIFRQNQVFLLPATLAYQISRQAGLNQSNSDLFIGVKEGCQAGLKLNNLIIFTRATGETSM